MPSPVVLPANCRIEVLVDMKRAVTDCRPDFSGGPDPQQAVINALWSVCPDATVGVVCGVLKEAMDELDSRIVFYAKINEEFPTPELEDWVFVATARWAGLEEVAMNLESGILYPAPLPERAGEAVVQLFYPRGRGKSQPPGS